ncbi:uncharacterized protein LOC122000238 [Zingiber officinale]|uniref:uncharacterized protein LOC122000238 n=1 Tax=Zingiber officinale TaxID=94328 RepID=UPI001C4B583E|nr:uncharacterized protein LOC122000238 [Zingiber officinale]
MSWALSKTGPNQLSYTDFVNLIWRELDIKYRYNGNPRFKGKLKCFTITRNLFPKPNFPPLPTRRRYARAETQPLWSFFPAASEGFFRRTLRTRVPPVEESPRAQEETEISSSTRNHNRPFLLFGCKCKQTVIKEKLRYEGRRQGGGDDGCDTKIRDDSHSQDRTC